MLKTCVLVLSLTVLLSTPGQCGLWSMLSSAASAVTTAVSTAITSYTNTTCYDDLGCFPMTAPWFTLFRLFPAPKSPDDQAVQLYCYSRNSTERYNVSVWPDIDLDGFPFQANRTTVLITHGFGNTGNLTWQDELKNGYLEQVDSNVCITDWGVGASDSNYMQVASNTRVVGAVLARFMRYLRSEYGMNASDVHLIGHSLGSHISSYVAVNLTGVARITGLDVAQPGFEGYEDEVRLTADDADFVDVIHTNGQPFLPSAGFGFQSAVGDVDIYVNGGRFQPGCEVPDFSSVTSLADLASVTVETLVNWVGCSHGRAFEYFIATLNSSCQIWARASYLDSSNVCQNTTATCNATSCIPLGLEVINYEGRGVFIAYTTSTTDYCDTEEVVNATLAEIAASSSS